MERRRAAILLLFGALSASAVSSVRAAPAGSDPADSFPEPAGLAPNVAFWVRVFSEWRTNQVAVHDLDHPAIVYAVVDLAGPIEERYTEAQREQVETLRATWAGYLEGLERRIAGGEALDELDKRWALHFATTAGTDSLAGAHARVRTQRGMRDRFRDGLARSGRFEGPFRRILREHGLPEDLVYLPHVESSFHYRALSSAGAAGLWQFTRGTGRLYLTINTALDERLDPIVATHGAARYLRDAHERLGSWPLAITSYNHGVAGMQRARERFGDDIERIVREYDGRAFGFASKNFYAEFLAARRIARDPATYFPEGVTFEPELNLDSIVLEQRVSPGWLASRYDVPLTELAALNTAWSARAVHDGLRLPVGTRVWLPPGALAAQARRGPSLRAAVMDGDGTTVVVRAGDTLSGIAAAHGIGLARLRELNGLPPTSSQIRVGQALRVGTAPAAAGIHVVGPGETLSTIAEAHRVSVGALRAANDLAAGTSLIRVGQELRLPSPAAVASPRAAHVVRRGETLGRIAARYGVALLDLLAANALSMRSVIHPGQVLHIPH
jgi:membrane-bound lytic murein transglycosylase D